MFTHYHYNRKPLTYLSKFYRVRPQPRQQGLKAARARAGFIGAVMVFASIPGSWENPNGRKRRLKLPRAKFRHLGGSQQDVAHMSFRAKPRNPCGGTGKSKV
jgi:hypothetical protein